MDLAPRIQQAQEEEGWQQHGEDGRTRNIKTLPSDSSDFNEKLALTCHTDQQKRVLSIYSSSNVEFFSLSLHAYQLNTHRPSYINAVLIQSCGIINPQPCSQCRQHPYRCPFLECVSLPHDWAGVCGCCKFKDWAQKCSLNDNSGPDRYRTTPHPDEQQGENVGGQAGLPPVIHEVTDVPYEIEEQDDWEDEAPPVVRQIS